MNNKNTVTVGYNTFKFPKWEGYGNIEESKDFINKSCLYDKDDVLELAAKMRTERQYFLEMLKFIEARLDNHISNAAPLGLCLDSSKEIFGIMITPCDIVKICPYCDEELQINGTDKSQLECPNCGCPYISMSSRIYSEKIENNGND